LQVLSGLNPQFHLVFNNVALGDQEGILPITYDPDGESRNATLVPGKKASLTVPVPVKRLDKYILSTISSPERIKLIKIDVEGYEFPVLRGLEAFFAESRCRPLIVCEVKPWEIEALGYTMSDFEQYMRGFGYRSYDIAQRHKPVSLSQLTDMEVVLFRV
jgi:FkbM family methyltransferase